MLDAKTLAAIKMPNRSMFTGRCEEPGVYDGLLRNKYERLPGRQRPRRKSVGRWENGRQVNHLNLMHR
jgi:hypothetical protein